MYRKLELDKSLLGINFSKIPDEYIAIVGECSDGDVLTNEDENLLILYTGGDFKLCTNDAFDFVLESDLKGNFKNIKYVGK